MAALEAGSGLLDASDIRPWGDLSGRSYTRFAEGDVLFAKITPCMENGKFAVARGLRNGLGVGSTEFHVIRCPQGLEAKYVFYLLLQQSTRKRARAVMSGAVGQLRVPADFLFELAIPVPPAAEQMRIVAEIEKQLTRLDTAVAALEGARANVKLYRASLLKAAIDGHLVPHRQSEFRTSLGELAVLITSGSRGWAEYYADKGPFFIRAQDINTDSLRLDSAARVRLPERAEGIRTRVAPGDLLVTITGANVAKTALVAWGIGEAYVSQHIALIRLKDPANAKFIYYWLVSPAHGRRALEAQAYGAGKPGLNLTQLRDLIIALPARLDQDSLIAALERRTSILEALEAAVDNALVRADRLRQSVLMRAFEGRLVSQDRKDEPASALLQRIRAERLGSPSVLRARRRRTRQGRLQLPLVEVVSS